MKVPSKKNWVILMIIFMYFLAWISALGSIELISTAVSGDSKTSFYFWFVLFIIGALFLLVLISWGRVFGTEVIRLNSNTDVVHFGKTVFGIGLKQKLNKTYLKNFRTEYGNDIVFGKNKFSAYGFGPGKVKFDYGMKTYSFALEVDDAEADYLVKVLNEHFHQK
jgi:hypothetical protein